MQVCFPFKIEYFMYRQTKNPVAVKNNSDKLGGSTVGCIWGRGKGMIPTYHQTTI